MGFLRKATFVATGGASGLVFKANSKKERVANALEKQNRQQRVRYQPKSAPAPVSKVAPLPTVAFPLANYNGGLAPHPQAEETGTFTLNDQKWELRFPGAPTFVHGGLSRYSVVVAATGDTSCRVAISDPQDATVLGRFDLPTTAPPVVLAELAKRREDLAKAHAAVKTNQPTPPALVGIADEIAKLAQLRDSGALTDDEFAAQKAKLLGT